MVEDKFEVPPMQCHEVDIRRTHRKQPDRLTPDISDERKAMFTALQNCCKKQCFQPTDVDMSIVIDTIRYCQKQTFERDYSEKYDIMRLKLEGIYSFVHFSILYW